MGNTKTFKDLLAVNQLLDSDLLAAYQPNVFNQLTQQNGDTRKITVSDLADYVIARQQKASVGKYQSLAFQPSPLYLAKNRLLVLNYQIIEIALYQDLCDMMWCGAAANDTAYFWYKCNADGTRNVNGLYMRVEDSRGMFYRGAGANAVFKAANNAPYDGGAIGGYKAESIAAHYHSFGSGMAFDGHGELTDGTQYIRVTSHNAGNAFSGTNPVGNNINYGVETKPCSISELRCIHY
jgi:hypothetical protein